MFEVGKKAVCINRDGWCLDYGLGGDVSGPKYKEVVTVSGIDSDPRLHGLYLEEYVGDSYNTALFIPLEENTEEEKAVIAEANEIIKEPQLV